MKEVQLSGCIQDLAFSPDQKYLATADSNRKVPVATLCSQSVVGVDPEPLRYAFVLSKRLDLLPEVGFGLGKLRKIKVKRNLKLNEHGSLLFHRSKIAEPPIAVLFGEAQARASGFCQKRVFK